MIWTWKTHFREHIKSCLIYVIQQGCPIRWLPGDPIFAVVPLQKFNKLASEHLAHHPDRK
jgi:hypothetical protein